MINDESTYFLNSNNIILDPKNNTIRISNAFHPDGSAPDMLDVTTKNGTKTLNIFKYDNRLTTDGGDMVYKFKDRREFIHFRDLISPIMHKDAKTQTAYRHSSSFVKEMEELLKEVTYEKNPGQNIELEIINKADEKAYGLAYSGERKIAINVRRIDPKLKHLALKTMYHENEHITQFNGLNKQNYLKWAPLSASDESFYFSIANPVEEGARIAGATFGRYNFEFAAEAMKDVGLDEWQEAENQLAGVLYNFAEANLGNGNLDDTTLKVYWGHSHAKETYPGRKTQRILRDYIESIATKTLSPKYQDADILQNISYNVLNSYIRQANAFNSGTSNISSDLSLSSWAESYVQRVKQDQRLIQKIEFNDSRIYDDRAFSLKKKIQDTFGGLFGSNSPPSNSRNVMKQAPNAPNMLSKITDIMFHGGNRIKWR